MINKKRKEEKEKEKRKKKPMKVNDARKFHHLRPM